jgi:hypothetical protein
MRALITETFFFFKRPFTFSPDPFRLQCIQTEGKKSRISLVRNRISYRRVDVCTSRSSCSFIHADIYLGRYERIARTKALASQWLKNSFNKWLLGQSPQGVTGQISRQGTRSAAFALLGSIYFPYFMTHLKSVKCVVQILFTS